MSIIRTQLRTILRPTVSVSRTFGTTSRVGASASSKHDNDPDVLAKEKARNLKGTQGSSAPLKEHAPGWNEHLASDSEAAIKADQAAPQGKPGRDLQDATIAQTHEHHHSDAGHHGAEAQKAKQNPDQTASEEFVKADQGKH